MLVAFDPGLGTFGIAAVEPGGFIAGMSACETTRAPEVDRPPSGHGRTSFDAADRDRRLREICDFCDSFIEELPAPPRVLVAEAKSINMGPNVGSAGVVSLASGSAVVSVFAWRYRLPVVWLSQLEWRRTFIPEPQSGRHGTYTQKEIVAAISRECGRDVEALAKSILKAQGRSITLRDHAIDALGIAEWSRQNSSVAKRLLGLIGPAAL